MPDSEFQSQSTLPTSSEGPDYPQKISSELAVLLNPQSEVAQSLVGSASKLRHMYIDAGIRSFCFTADEEGVGTTFVAANVAAAMASMGLRTLLIEANLLRPRMARMFDLPQGSAGLGDWLEDLDDGRSWLTFMHPVYPGLAVVPAGKVDPSVASAFSVEWTALVSELVRAFDAVILDAPSLRDEASLLPILAVAECTVVVARQDVSKVASFAKFEDLIAKSNSRFGGYVYLGK